MSSVDFNIIAESRADVGKGASRRLRRTGKVPGILYGSGKDPLSLTVDHDDLMHHLDHEAFYSHILTVTVDGKAEKAVLKDLQRHPAKRKVLHVDFLRVSDKDVIHMQVPMHFINEDISVGVKAGGLVSHLMTTVEITCMAGDLPEYLQVDLADLEVGASLHLSDIKLPEGVAITALTHGEDHDLPVVSINAPKGGGETDEAETAPEAAAEEGGEAGE
ncbi:MAG TPA: 50S ribosomal protein L25/general stress protein Ctc [Gammaproteobacteria bacterium]|nr:50S ribosomal protein L25/general stress protein Ctc [Gammaproteobacteria bacterium]